MNATAFSQNWNGTIDPRLIQGSYYPYQLNNPWISNGGNPLNTENGLTANPFLRSYAEDAFLPIDTSQTPNYSFDYGDVFSADYAQDPSTLFTPLPTHTSLSQTPTQAVNAHGQIDLAPFEFPPFSQFDPTMDLPSVQPMFDGSFFGTLDTTPMPPVTNMTREPVPLAGFSERTELLEAKPFQTGECMPTTMKMEDSLNALPSVEASVSSSRAVPASPAICFRFLTPNDFTSPAPIPARLPTKRRSKHCKEDPNCGFVVEYDVRGKKFYQCKICPEMGTYHRGDMRRHQMSSRHKAPSFGCTLCNKTFTRPDALKRHMSRKNAHTPKAKRKYMGPVGDEVKEAERAETYGPTESDPLDFQAHH